MPAVVAAQRDSGLVVDEAAFAFRATLDVAAVAADHDRGGAPAVDDQDGSFARGKGLEGGPEGAREEAAVAGGQLGAQVHHLDARRSAAGAV